MTTSKFMAIQQALQPDWFQCLSDGEATCDEATSIKRARKSVDRSLLFLDNCLKLQEESEVKLCHSPLLFFLFHHTAVSDPLPAFCSSLLGLFYSLDFFPEHLSDVAL